MAPEVLKGSTQYDQRCDIWSIGVFAFELAEGVPPFPKKGQQRTIYNILTKAPPKLKQDDAWSENFHSFIEDCMTKDPEERPTAKQLLKHPFMDFDWDEYKQEYLDYKQVILKSLNVIKEDDEEYKFEGFETHSTSRLRSNTIKSGIN